jgi:hypothetical protein
LQVIVALSPRHALAQPRECAVPDHADVAGADRQFRADLVGLLSA